MFSVTQAESRIMYDDADEYDMSTMDGMVAKPYLAHTLLVRISSKQTLNHKGFFNSSYEYLFTSTSHKRTESSHMP